MRAGDTALAEFVKITEKFFNADAFHDNGGLETLLNFAGVVRDDDMRLHEAVVDHINVPSLLLEEGGDLLWAHTDLLKLLRLRALGLVGGEHVLRTVHILAEVEVVDLLGVTAVAVAAGNEIKHFLAGRHNIERLHDAEELLCSDVLLRAADTTDAGAVEVHEAGFEEDAVGDDVPVELRHHLNHLLLLLVREHLFEFSASLRWRFWICKFCNLQRRCGHSESLQRGSARQRTQCRGC